MPTSEWDQVPDLINRWAAATIEPLKVIRKQAALLYTQGKVGLYWHPDWEWAAAVDEKDATDDDLRRASGVLAAAVGKDWIIPGVTVKDAQDYGWVKVAGTTSLRDVGTNLNFFPGNYTGGIPNSASPLAATLTGGLLGAGLGYAGGWLGEKFVPSWKRGRIRNTLVGIGGILGAAPGAAYMASAAAAGHGPLDNTILNQQPGDPAHLLTEDLVPKTVTGSDWDPPTSAELAAGAAKMAYETFGIPQDPSPRSPMSVNIDQLGRTLWDIGSDPRSTAAAMGLAYTAQQLPVADARQGEVTPHQMGLLGTLMGAAGGGLGGYLVGRSVGMGLCALAGMPEDQQATLAQAGMGIGVVRALASRLF